VDVVVKAAPLGAIIALGYTIKRVGWVRSEDFVPFSVVALRVTLPCAVAVSMNSFDLQPSLFVLPVLGLAVSLVLQGLGYAVGARGGRPARAFGVLNLGAFNIGLFAIPYVSTFVGPDAIAYAVMFDIGNAIGAAGIAYGWGLTLANGQGRVSASGLARMVFSSPVLIVYLLLVGMRLLDLHLPGPVLAFAQTVGSANTFLAMLMIGIGLEVVLARHKYARALGLLGVRYAVAALFCVAVWFLPGLDPSVRVVVCMLAWAPIGAMVVAFTGEAGLDVETSAFMTSLSVLVAIVAMPVALGVASALVAA